MGGTSAALYELDLPSSNMGKWEDESEKPMNLDAMHCTETALGRVSLPPRVCFVSGKAVYMQFDGGY